jgi:hypothetical protein
MAVVANYGGSFNYYYGLSTDTKPIDALAWGSKFYETDTGNTYVFADCTWCLSEKELPLFLDNTDIVNGIFTVIEAFTDCNFTLLSSNITTSDGNMLTVGRLGTLYQGTRIYGVFTQVQLTNGKAILYR